MCGSPSGLPFSTSLSCSRKRMFSEMCVFTLPHLRSRGCALGECSTSGRNGGGEHGSMGAWEHDSLLLAPLVHCSGRPGIQALWYAGANHAEGAPMDIFE